jgi:hypothetical protein
LFDCVAHFQKALSASHGSHLSQKVTPFRHLFLKSGPPAVFFLAAALLEAVVAPEKAPVLQLDQGAFGYLDRDTSASNASLLVRTLSTIQLPEGRFGNDPVNSLFCALKTA